MQNNLSLPSIETLRRTAAEVLAAAVLDLYPDTLLVGGGSHSLGFYYDFAFKQASHRSHKWPVGHINQEYLPQIEERFRALVTENLPIQTLTMVRQNAMEFFHHHHQPLKAALVGEENSQLIDIFKLNDFYDTCLFSPPSSIGVASAFKLIKISSQEKIVSVYEPLLVTRIEGVVAFDKMSLKQMVKMFDQVQKFDHRQLGPSLGLFCFDPSLAPGCCLWLPKGEKIKERLTQDWQASHLKEGFELISTPALVNPSLIQKMGAQFYEEAALSPFQIDEADVALAPSLNAQHALLFKHLMLKVTSQNLPQKFAEVREVYSGLKNYKLEGLFYTRSFISDCATIFCTRGQLKTEVISSLQFIERMIRIFDFETRWHLHSVAPSKAAQKEGWQQLVSEVKKALEELGIYFNEEESKYQRRNKPQAMFLGPTLELILIDKYGREWPGPRIEINALLPKRLGLFYEKSVNKEKLKKENINEAITENKNTSESIIMISRTFFGSLERFIALLLEQYQGNMPL